MYNFESFLHKIYALTVLIVQNSIFVWIVIQCEWLKVILMKEMSYATLFTLGVIATSIMLPEFFERNSIKLMVFCIVILGIPHGALDHILYYALATQRKSLPDEKWKRAGAWIPALFFYVNYITIMMLWAALWDYKPNIAFWSFLGVSSYHFGEVLIADKGELDYLTGISKPFSLILYFSRGSLLVGTTLTAQPELTLPIVQKLIEMEQHHFFALCDFARPWIIIQHAICLLMLSTAITNPAPLKRGPLPVKTSRVTHDVLLFEWSKSLLLLILFYKTNPLVGFAVFFGVWHSSSTIWSAIKYLKNAHPSFQPSDSISIKDILTFYYLAFPYTAISLAGMFIMYMSSRWIDLDIDPALVWAVFISSISVLTGAHMWIIAALHWRDVPLDPCNVSILFGKEQILKSFQIE